MDAFTQQFSVPEALLGKGEQGAKETFKFSTASVAAAIDAWFNTDSFKIDQFVKELDEIKLDASHLRAAKDSLTAISGGRMTGKSATMVIIDDPLMERECEEMSETMDSYLSKFKEAKQFNFNNCNVEDLNMAYTGGMVSVLYDSGQFRKKPLQSTNLVLANFYDGKKLGVISKFKVDSELAKQTLMSNGGLGNVRWVEIPLKDWPNVFDHSAILALVSRLTGEAQAQIKRELYSDEAIAELEDFGAF